MRVLFRRKLRKTQAHFQQNVCFYLLVGWVLLKKKNVLGKFIAASQQEFVTAKQINKS